MLLLWSDYSYSCRVIAGRGITLCCIKLGFNLDEVPLYSVFTSKYFMHSMHENEFFLWGRLCLFLTQRDR